MSLGTIGSEDEFDSQLPQEAAVVAPPPPQAAAQAAVQAAAPPPPPPAVAPPPHRRGINLTLDNLDENDIKKKIKVHPLFGKFTPPFKFISFGEQIKDRFNITDDALRGDVTGQRGDELPLSKLIYKNYKKIENETCKYRIQVYKHEVPKKETENPTIASPQPPRGLPVAPPPPHGALDVRREQEENLKIIKDTVDDKAKDVAIKVYTISTERKVPDVNEPWCWAKVLNMFLDEIYYQNAAYYVLDKLKREKSYIMVKSPEVIASFYNFDKVNHFLELYIVSELINVRDLTTSEKKIVPDRPPGAIKTKDRIKQSNTQKSASRADMQLKKDGIYHNDLVVKKFKSVFDPVPLRTIFHTGNLKKEIDAKRKDTGYLVIFDFGAARDHEAPARGILKKKPKKSKKRRKSKKTRKTKKRRKSKKTRKSKKRKSKKRRKSKKTRKSKKRKSKKPRKSKKKRKKNLK